MRSRLLWVGLVAMPGVVQATDYMWCVDGSGTAPPFDCVGGMSCASDSSGTSEFSTVTSALNGARSVAGAGDAHHVCVWTSGTHTETILVDNSDGSLGDSVDLYFQGQGADYCAGTGGNAAIDFSGDPGAEPRTAFGVRSMNSDFGSCGTTPTSLLSVRDAELTVEGARVSNYGGHFVTAESSLEEPNVRILGTRVERFAGAALRGRTSAFIDNSEISGCRPPDGVAIFDITPESNNINATYSAIFGNGTYNAPLLRLPQNIRMSHFTVAANVVGGTAPLLRWVPTGSPEAVIGGSAFARNRFVTSGSYAPPPAVVPDPSIPGNEQYCLPLSADGDSYFDRPSPTSPAADRAGVLWEVAPSTPSAPVLTLMRNFFVDSELDGGAVVGLQGELGELVVTVAHSTISGPVDSVVSDAQATGGEAALTLARNLYVADAPPTLNDNWRAIEATLEGGAASEAAWQAALASNDSTRILGPFLESPTSFRSASEIDSLSLCELLELSCANFLGDCAGVGPTPSFIVQSCTLDRARDYHPTAEFNAATAVEWPWTGSYFPRLPDGDPLNRLGATGFDCNTALVARDGDGDGSTELTDCADETANSSPELPSPNGFDSDECIDDPGDCWACPDGSTLLPPPGDDDDTVDDDDSSGGDDDDGGDPDDDDSEDEPAVVYTSCLGCGVPLSGGGANLALLPLLLGLGLRRYSRPAQ